MELQYWIWIAVGLSFSLYIGIAIWSRAGSTKQFDFRVDLKIGCRLDWQLNKNSLISQGVSL